MAEGNAISVKIGAETDGIEQGLRSIQSSLGRLENSSKQSGDIFDASFGKIAGATAVGQLAVKAFTGVVDAAFAGVRNTVAEFGNALDLGGRLSDLSSRTGETAGNLLLLERAFDNSGVGAEKVGQSVNKLQKFMEDASAGGKNQTEVMNALGLSLADLAGKAPTEQMQIFASRIAGIEDPGKRAALAMEIFGQSGGELLPLLSNFSGELETARGQLGSMTDIMDRRAAVFDSVSDKIAIISRKFTDFAAGILDRAIPALDAITEGLSRIDAAAIGQKLADAFLGGTGAMSGFQAAVDAFSTGNISGALSILWDSIVLQAQMSANSILKNLSAAFTTAGQILAQIFRSDGPAMMLLRQSFTMIGGFISEKLYTALSDFMSSIGRLQMAEVFKYKAETAAREVSTALESIPTVARATSSPACKRKPPPSPPIRKPSPPPPKAPPSNTARRTRASPRSSPSSNSATSRKLWPSKTPPTSPRPSSPRSSARSPSTKPSPPATPPSSSAFKNSSTAKPPKPASTSSPRNTRKPCPSKRPSASPSKWSPASRPSPPPRKPPPKSAPRSRPSASSSPK